MSTEDPNPNLYDIDLGPRYEKDEVEEEPVDETPEKAKTRTLTERLAHAADDRARDEESDKKSKKS